MEKWRHLHAFFFEMLSLEIWSTSRFILFLKWACNPEINEIWTLMFSIFKKSIDDKLAGVASIPFFFLFHRNFYLYQSAWGQKTKFEIHFTYLERLWKNCNVHPSWPNHDLSHKKDQNSPNPHWKHHGILPTIDVFQKCTL